MSVVALSVSNDGVLGVVAPIGMAAAAGTCLVVDLVNRGSRDGVSLASLTSEGPQRSHLQPSRRGVSFLHNGGVGFQAAGGVLNALFESWPNVLVAVPDRSVVVPNVRTVVVEAILAGPFVPPVNPDAVLQPVGLGGRPREHRGHVLSPLRPKTVRSILSGTVDRRSAWVRSWTPVWESL